MLVEIALESAYFIVDSPWIGQIFEVEDEKRLKIRWCWTAHQTVLINSKEWEDNEIFFSDLIDSMKLYYTCLHPWPYSKQVIGNCTVQHYYDLEPGTDVKDLPKDCWFYRYSYDNGEKVSMSLLVLTLQMFKEAQAQTPAGRQRQREATKNKTLTRLNGLDLFSGCGGLSYGLEQVGINISTFSFWLLTKLADAVECWSNAAATFRKYHNKTRMHEVKIQDFNSLIDLVFNEKEPVRKKKGTWNISMTDDQRAMYLITMNTL